MSYKRKLRSGVALVAIAIGLGLSAPEAHAATFEVTTLADSGPGSLRAAIDAANMAAGADMITFQSGLTGMITLTSGQLEIEDTVIVHGPGASALTVSGNDASRVFYISQFGSNVEITISGLKIVHGSTTGNGAGILADCGRLTLDALDISDNSAAPQTTGQGGGAWVRVSMGAAIVGSRITGNNAQVGGGLFVESAEQELTIEQTTVMDNQATTQGGGVFVRATGPGTTIAIRSSSLFNNSAAEGGALAFDSPDGPIEIENATLWLNLATDGSTLYCAYCEDSATIRHSTIVAGGTPVGGPANGTLLVEHGLVTLSHTIVASKLSGPSPVAQTDLVGMFAADHCVIESPSTSTSTIMDGGGNILSQDPRLSFFGDNGGPTWTQLIEWNSPAIDAGDPNIAAAPMFDQRNGPRIVGDRIDIGALERRAGTVQCTIAEQTVSETGGSVTVMVTRTENSDDEYQIAYETAEGSAESPDDYLHVSGTLHWAKGESDTKAIQISLVDDHEAESNQSFVFNLSDPLNKKALGSVTTATITITDDDSAPTISEIADLTLTEGATSAPVAFTVGDADDGPYDLEISATSSYHQVLADDGISFAGLEANRTLTVTARTGGDGESTVTVRVSDGTNVTKRTFKVTVVHPTTTEQDAAVTEPHDSGTPMKVDAGTSRPDGAPGEPVAEPDSGSATQSDSGSERDAGAIDDSTSSGCGCDVPGRSGKRSKALLAGLIGLACVVWRRRRR